MPEQEQEEEIQERQQGCWLEYSRICGPDCIAFDDRCAGDPRFNPCLVLNVGRSIMVSFAGIEKALQGQERARKNKELTERANVPPPEVKS